MVNKFMFREYDIRGVYGVDINEEVLAELKKKVVEHINPLYQDIKTFEETIRRNDIVISRLRDTGIYIHYDNKIYNVDIDFLWEVYLSLFGNYDKFLSFKISSISIS